MGNNAPIGVFDSGLGGLTVVKEMLNLLPGEDIIYFGDTARTPYGSRPPAEIIMFMHEILRFFTVQKVKMAVFACNTMTALGLEEAKRTYSFFTVGVNTGVKAALKVTRSKQIGVIATQATVASGYHGRSIRRIDAGAAIFPQACPKFVPLIEQGKLDGAEVEAAVAEYLVPLKEAGIDSLILGCTHYPFISPIITRVLGTSVSLVDPARETVVDARDLLAKHGQLAVNRQGTVRLCFSADLDRVQRFAGKVLSLALRGAEPNYELVNLQEYSSCQV
ncbi:MAG TPA: glutamate racemase [Methylomusa anaerophila]|uniref:Glutamate racemase n=1 Tax=Methylomusa anaerophila TaxID=1930071 RepID=A0A348AG05_9FIRM|nr:glutamate racemase [Methylomusa anaerophila]BBB90003.1 glutamate racemase [Methylomusa anaerophila]HML88268.1 glutamate racemase [Methylomusa anaerophila]